MTHPSPPKQHLINTNTAAMACVRMLATRNACNSHCLGQAFHFRELDSGAVAKPASVVFYGRAWPLDHGLGAAEQSAKGPHTTPRAWNLHMKLHLAVFNWKQEAYSPVSPLGCPQGVGYLRTFSPQTKNWDTLSESAGQLAVNHFLLNLVIVIP